MAVIFSFHSQRWLVSLATACFLLVSLTLQSPVKPALQDHSPSTSTSETSSSSPASSRSDSLWSPAGQSRPRRTQRGQRLTGRRATKGPTFHLRFAESVAGRTYDALTAQEQAQVQQTRRFFENTVYRRAKWDVNFVKSGAKTKMKRVWENLPRKTVSWQRYKGPVGAYESRRIRKSQTDAAARSNRILKARLKRDLDLDLPKSRSGPKRKAYRDLPADQQRGKMKKQQENSSYYQQVRKGKRKAAQVSDSDTSGESSEDSSQAPYEEGQSSRGPSSSGAYPDLTRYLPPPHWPGLRHRWD